MSNNKEKEEKSPINEIATFKVGLHPLPSVNATSEEIQAFIDKMPFSEEEKKAFQKAREAIEREEGEPTENET